MKLLLLLALLASAAANVILFIRRNAEVASPDAPAAAAPLAAQVERAKSAPGDSSHVSAPAETKAADVWAMIRRGDPRCVDALRALGYPETVVRAIIRAEIDEIAHEKGRAASASRAAQPYWADYSQEQAQYAEFDRLFGPDWRKQRADLLSKLLGPDQGTENAIRNLQYYPLSAQKATALQQLEDDYHAMRTEVRGQGWDRILLPEERQKLAYLEQEQRKDLTQLLSPAELFEYEVRHSRTAQSLRSRIAAFDPTEEEFRKIFRLAQDAEQKHGVSRESFSMADFETQQGAFRDLEQQLKTTLSPERYAEYQDSKNMDYRRLAEIGSRLDLPRDRVREAWAYQKEVQKAATEMIRNFRDLPPDQAAAKLAAYEKEVSARLGQILGADGLQAFKDNAQLWNRFKLPARRAQTPPIP